MNVRNYVDRINFDERCWKNDFWKVCTMSVRYGFVSMRAFVKNVTLSSNLNSIAILRHELQLVEKSKSEQILAEQSIQLDW